ncbi:MAG TPA: prenyltransferase/squalene oxidase repeat-containing protein [Gemmataceae bacterium]|nr:prenyltransferase/squalene oxidase repeat-containing protein [Gemmataceae bacterium]
MKRLMVLVAAVALFCSAVRANAQEGKDKGKPEDLTKALAAAREKGLDWLTKNQAKDGSWGKTYTIAVTSFACLSYLSVSDEPYTGERGKVLIKGLNYLLNAQKDGQWTAQGHSWIHGQGFATLALSEAYGRSLFCKVKPDIDTKKLREVVAAGIKVIGNNQSNSGGWWYTPGNKNGHEGSTTVCAVQAIVSASNFGIPIDEKVLDKGFEYLKKCQTKEGGFNYQLGDGRNMHEGTAAAVSTLGLMQKFDFQVMINGYKYLLKITPKTISNERFPYYGHFYGIMGMQLLGQEYKDDKAFRENTGSYIAASQKDLLSWQEKEGTWPLKSWVRDSNVEDARYATAYAVLALGVSEARLSIYNRTPPKLPKEEKK